MNDSSSSVTCQNIYLGDPINESFGLFQLIFALVQIVVVLLIIYAHKRNKRIVRQTFDVDRSRTLLLPIYSRFLPYLAWTFFYNGLVHACFSFSPETGSVDLWQSLLISLSKALFTVFEAIAFLLVQKGAGTVSSLRAIKATAVWAVFTFVSSFVIASDQNRLIRYALLFSCESILVVFYLAYAVLPRSILFMRPAMRVYARFWALYHILFLIGHVLAFVKIDFAFCNYSVCALLWALVLPFVVFSTLQDDSAFWQGTSNSGNKNKLTAPLLGFSLGFQVASSLASNMDYLDLKTKVQVLNFAFLDLGKTVIGRGGTSKVFEGKYKGHRVAVKMLYCIELTPDIISSFINEANLLTLMNSNHIVKLIGVCILPPSVCLVMELCRGNLENHVRNNPQLTMAERLEYMLQASQAVEYLHSMKPTPILHMDLKAQNFLLDQQGKLKLSDLELSRKTFQTKEKLFRKSNFSLSTFLCVPDFAQCVRSRRSWSQDLTMGTITETNSDADALLSQSHSEYEQPDQQEEENKARALPETINWTAPEVLLEGVRLLHSHGIIRRFKTSSDVYALAMVCYEILTGKVPFAAERTKLLKDNPRMSFKEALDHLTDRICRQPTEEALRPPFPAGTPQGLDTLLQRGWDTDPDKRPTASVFTGLVKDVLIQEYKRKQGIVYSVHAEHRESKEKS